MPSGSNAETVLQTFAILGRGTDDPSAHFRLLVWQDTLRLGRDHPWTGTGLNTFSWAFPLYKRPMSGELHYTHTENDYLQAFAEGGLLFMTFLTLTLLWGGAQLLSGWSRSERPYARGLGLGLLVDWPPCCSIASATSICTSRPMRSSSCSC